MRVIILGVFISVGIIVPQVWKKCQISLSATCGTLQLQLIWNAPLSFWLGTALTVFPQKMFRRINREPRVCYRDLKISPRWRMTAF